MVSKVKSNSYVSDFRIDGITFFQCVSSLFLCASELLCFHFNRLKLLALRAASHRSLSRSSTAVSSRPSLVESLFKKNGAGSFLSEPSPSIITF